MKDKTIFFGLLVYVVVLTNIHNISILSILFIFSLLLSYKTMFRVIKVVSFFNFVVSIGVIIQSFILGTDCLDFILLFNLRVFDITFAVLFTTSIINLIEVFSFSKELKFLLIAVLSQIKSFQKTFEDFNLVFKSRVIKKLNQQNKKDFVARMFYFFLKKSLYYSKERTLALKARGFFD